MENPSEVPPETQVDGPDSPTSRGFPDHGLRTELESLRQSYRSLLSRFAALEESLNLHQQERDEAVTRNADLVKVIGEITSERNSLSGRIRELEASMREQEDRCAVRIEEEGNERERLKKDAETYRERIENLEAAREKSNGFLLKCVDSLRLAKESLFRIINNVDEEEIENGGKENDGVGVELELELEEELRAVSDEIMEVTRLAGMAELKVNEYKELGKKEKRELENSVVSLTEENRDINSLLRIALVEKEAVEKSLTRLKGNNDQKRVPLLQIAERGLQRVGFGFMMGSGSGEHSSESSGTKLDTSGTKSDSSECEEEVVSLASTVERIMKNLRLEITQLRRSLEESRSDTERLQSLAEKQAQDIAENMLYIKELENRERILAQNVDELLMEVKETETEVARWREACELEVEAGKHEIVERDKVVTILTQELEKTKTALDMSNRKLNVKEELAAAAMVAQAAAEKSLQLADRRAAGLRERVEELSRQLEEAESQERSRRKVRHLCWPWRVLKLNTADSANDRLQNVRRMLPEMQAFLH